MSTGSGGTNDHTVAYASGRVAQGGNKSLCRNWSNTGKCSYGKFDLNVSIVFSFVHVAQAAFIKATACVPGSLLRPQHVCQECY